MRFGCVHKKKGSWTISGTTRWISSWHHRFRVLLKRRIIKASSSV